MPHPEPKGDHYSLPCEECSEPVIVHIRDEHRVVNAWLDGEITFRCVLHRARNPEPVPEGAQ